jgi:hypothetical protein
MAKPKKVTKELTEKEKRIASLKNELREETLKGTWRGAYVAARKGLVAIAKEGKNTTPEQKKDEIIDLLNEVVDDLQE